MPQKGYVSGSRFASMMTSGRRKDEHFGAVAKKLMTKIVFERNGLILEEDNFITHAMQWGIDQEPYAISRFEQITGESVHSSQVWQQHPDHEMVGITPDGLVEKDYVLEVKCPMTENHIENVFFGTQVESYKWQIQGSLWVTGREACYFVSYDPRSKIDISVREIARDDKAIEQLEERYHLFEQEIARLQAILEEQWHG